MIRSRLMVASMLAVGLLFARAPWGAAVAAAAEGEHAAATATEHAAAADAGHGAADTNPLTLDPDLAVFTAIVFLMLLAVLWKFAWGPIAEALDRREQGIAGQIDEAHRSNEEAKRLLAEHQARLDGATAEVKELLEQARRDAESQKQQIVVQAQQAAEAEKDRALREIGAAKNQALQQLAEKSVDTAVELAGRIVHRQLKPEDHVDLIKETLPRLPSNN